MDGKKEGMGIYKYTDGTYHHGHFKNDKIWILKEGTVKYEDGSVFEGKIEEGERHGRLTNANGTVIHDGHCGKDEPLQEVAVKTPPFFMTPRLQLQQPWQPRRKIFDSLHSKD